ncbi:MAG: polysaccharide deacetylase family protein [Methanophagales archaeon]|nr:polysaccharide deacetylase family protein [Methanophagales archaeon]
MINALTIDLEDWYHPEFVAKLVPGHQRKDQIEDAVKPLLELLDKYNISATFFVLGQVAERHPELIETISKKGHEIASHGYSHKRLHELGKEKFEDDLRKSTKLLESIIKDKIIGFRAPSYSLDQDTIWALDVIEATGYKYDSSVFPLRFRKKSLYGVHNALLYPYSPSMEDITMESDDRKIIEFPLSVVKFAGVKIPVAGGAYLRLFPAWFLRLAIKKINKEKRPAIIYVHPWETYEKTPRIKLPYPHKLITYYGIESSLKKVESLLKNFRFGNIRDILFH